MTWRMADSIYPADLRGLPAYINCFAGYHQGNWPDYQQIFNEHPGAPVLDFSVFLQNVGTGGDFEPGDMNPGDVVAYVNMRHAQGVARPVVYASVGGYMGQCIANLQAANISLDSVRLLTAHYGGWMHICGPTTCKIGPASWRVMDGTQWT